MGVGDGVLGRGECDPLVETPGLGCAAHLPGQALAA